MLRSRISKNGKQYVIQDELHGVELRIKDSKGMQILHRLINSKSASEIFLPFLYHGHTDYCKYEDSALKKQLGEQHNNLTGLKHNALDYKAITEYKARIKQIKSIISNGKPSRRELLSLINEKNRLETELKLNKYNQSNFEPSLRKIYDTVRVNLNNVLKQIAEVSPITAKMIKSNLTISSHAKLGV